uniref:Uncharacterized protein n=1 Tax=Oryza sativa subsp. japonica TaxID=39947 RepID=Q69Q55_ORYSJ|nr:hypothetical protein [Oryza sativa Japonica Group]
MGFRQREAVAEMTHAAVKLAVAAAWRGGGSSGDGALPEAAVGGGASGTGGADVAGIAPDFTGDVGVGHKMNPAHFVHARGAGDAGERAAMWGGRGSGAAWAREERRRWGGSGGCRLGRGWPEVRDDPTGGAHLSASQREGGVGPA